MENIAVSIVHILQVSKMKYKAMKVGNEDPLSGVSQALVMVFWRNSRSVVGGSWDVAESSLECSAEWSRTEVAKCLLVFAECSSQSIRWSPPPQSNTWGDGISKWKQLDEGRVKWISEW